MIQQPIFALEGQTGMMVLHQPLVGELGVSDYVRLEKHPIEKLLAPYQQ